MPPLLLGHHMNLDDWAGARQGWKGRSRAHTKVHAKYSLSVCMHHGAVRRRRRRQRAPHPPPVSRLPDPRPPISSPVPALSYLLSVWISHFSRCHTSVLGAMPNGVWNGVLFSEASGFRRALFGYFLTARVATCRGQYVLGQGSSSSRTHRAFLLGQGIGGANNGAAGRQAALLCSDIIILIGMVADTALSDRIREWNFVNFLSHAHESSSVSGHWDLQSK